MKIRCSDIPGVLVIEPVVHGDGRGFFLETWHEERYREAGIGPVFVQDNLSLSARGVLRGLHFQEPEAQGKLVTVLVGEVWDVAVDLRRGSPTFGRHVGVRLSAENHVQLWLPPGMAHGFCVLSEQALLAYKCTTPYRPAFERGVAWDDPTLAIPWPVDDPVVSERDAALPRLDELDEAKLPVYGVSRIGEAKLPVDDDGPTRDDDGPTRDDHGPTCDDDGPTRDDHGPTCDDDGPTRDDDGPTRDDDGCRDGDASPETSPFMARRKEAP